MLYTHEKGSKVQIFTDNGLSMFCHGSHCYRNQYCRIYVWYRDEESKIHDGSYELPAYGSCCFLPQGYIESATLYEYGF
ncbi:hypothetical protein Tdes44962_MAKER03554 [Teratosphaeria destructans]|uniref:Uncharacterized protein n=1 Tax=Teratosphaeria destructans TaxID=418781 RepID=A0A9W7SPF8_9PEZI|nr:hypothetical protein Tdes44962_MAKER03554 [Teratosphaeria destructans]